VDRLPPGLPPPPPPRWEVAEAPSVSVVDGLAAELRLPPALCRLLAVRGMVDPEAARVFLRPLLEHLHPPALLKDAEAAADRILEAVEAGETVLVHGDYDVDGICASALLTGVIRQCGGAAVPFVPHRLRDGYDLGPSGLEAARAAGARLLVTVDCGILAHEAVEQALGLGLDVVITDHHTVGETLPAAHAVVNPNRPDDDSPTPHLCGAGVAFKVAQLLAEKAGLDDPLLLSELDLVALATIADLVPLEGENRTLVRYGLRVLAQTQRPGLQALMDVAGVDPGKLTAGRVGFVLAPRINAAGRMGETDSALELLMTTDKARATALARRLDEENRRRQEEDQRTLQEALEELAESFDPGRDFGVVLAREGWHPGVIGIVASRVVEHVHRPTVLVAIDGERGRGSARSIPGFHLYEALSECSDHMLRFGGHRQAAGMDLSIEALSRFRESFADAARRRLADGSLLTPVLKVDLELDPDEISPDLVRFLQYAGPFGMGNRRPVFVSRSMTPEGAREVGAGHLKLRLRSASGLLDAIGFGLVKRFSPASLHGRTVDAVYQLEENHFRGRSTIQARLLDLRFSGAG
jgi:single-stranded-DNA-specific exonuclease